MAKIWDAICNAVGRRETAAERNAVLGAAPYTFRPPEPPPMPEFPTERPMTARQRDFEMRLKQDFAAGRRTTYVNSFGQLISFRPDELAAAQKEMAETLERLDRGAAPGFDFPPHARIPERPAHFGKRKEPPPPLPLPKDTANICTMVIREDLAFLRRIEEIRLTGGQPAVIDFLRQSDLSSVIAYAIETADANGELAGMTWLRAWSEGGAAAHAELRAYRLEQNSY